MRSRASVLKLGMAVTLSLGVADLGLINLVLAPRLAEESQRSGRGTTVETQPGGGPRLAAAAAPARAPDEPPTPRSKRAVSVRTATASAAPPSATPAAPPPSTPAAPKPEPRPARARPPARPPPIYFATDHHGLDERGEGVARRVAAVMKRRVELKVECQGHADRRGDPDKNETLSRLRAEAVAGALVELGVARARIDTRWFGSSRPATDLQTPQAWARNRRVELQWR